MSKTSKILNLRPHLVASTALAAVAVLGASAYASGASSAPSPASTTSASAPARAQLELRPSSPALARCYPHAAARVTVDLTTDQVGKDSFTIGARGLKPRTDFTVFLVEKAAAPFGAAEYIGDFTTDRWGRANNRYDLIVEEAFAFNNETQARTDLNSVGVWFADPTDDDGCLGAGSPVTGFDGDASAGVQMLNSGMHLLP
ncbi:MAG: hypothetical protein JWM84_186 [Nocardioides sp.]|jgi:hypothetical protein|nr:hypothetical protein [Nocardioides sp.]